jgi:hypothetical protein
VPSMRDELLGGRGVDLVRRGTHFGSHRNHSVKLIDRPISYSNSEPLSLD